MIGRGGRAAALREEILKALDGGNCFLILTARDAVPLTEALGPKRRRGESCWGGAGRVVLVRSKPGGEK